MKKHWTFQSEENMKYIGIIEFKDNKDEYYIFYVYDTKDSILFGDHANTGFMQSGYYIKDNTFSFDENLNEFYLDLEVFYNEGYKYTSNNFIVNDRM